MTKTSTQVKRYKLFDNTSIIYIEPTLKLNFLQLKISPRNKKIHKSLRLTKACLFVQSSNEDLPAFHQKTNEYHKKLEKPHKKQIKTQIENQKKIQNLASSFHFSHRFSREPNSKSRERKIRTRGWHHRQSVSYRPWISNP